MFNPDLIQLQQTALSIIQQDSKDFEYIIQDGGSTDPDVIHLAKSYADNLSFVQFNSKPDKSIYEGMNNAVLNATGDFVIFINVGDLLISSDIISKVAEFLNDDVDILASLRLFNGNNMSNSTTIFQKRLNIKFIRNLCHQTYLVRRQLIHFDTSLKLAADFKLLWEVYTSKQERISYIDFPICFYQAGGISDLSKKKVYLETIRAIISNKKLPTQFKCVNVLLYFFRIVRLWI